MQTLIPAEGDVRELRQAGVARAGLVPGQVAGGVQGADTERVEPPVTLRFTGSVIFPEEFLRWEGF